MPLNQVAGVIHAAAYDGLLVAFFFRDIAWSSQIVLFEPTGGWSMAAFARYAASIRILRFAFPRSGIQPMARKATRRGPRLFMKFEITRNPSGETVG